jgi:hypothetical protein
MADAIDINEVRAAWDERIKPEPPRPLMRELPPADRFPVDALGDILGDTALAIHDRVQAPIAIGAQSVLAAGALTVQAYADVELPIGQGSSRPISGYFVSSAETGERKTACDHEASWPVERFEARLREEHGLAMPSYENDKLAWEKAREHALRAKKGDRGAMKVDLDALGTAPAAPLHPMLTCPEPTFEGLVKLFAHSRPSLGIFSARGGPVHRLCVKSCRPPSFHHVSGRGTNSVVSEQARLWCQTGFRCGTASSV